MHFIKTSFLSLLLLSQVWGSGFEKNNLPYIDLYQSNAPTQAHHNLNQNFIRMFNNAPYSGSTVGPEDSIWKDKYANVTFYPPSLQLDGWKCGSMTADEGSLLYSLTFEPIVPHEKTGYLVLSSFYTKQQSPSFDLTLRALEKPSDDFTLTCKALSEKYSSSSGLLWEHNFSDLDKATTFSVLSVFVENSYIPQEVITKLTEYLRGGGGNNSNHS